MIKLLCVTGNVFQPKSGGDQAVYNAIRLLSGHVEMHVFIVDNKSLCADYLSQIKKDLSLSGIFCFNISIKDRYEKVHQLCKRMKKFIQKLAKLEKEAALRELNLDINLERNFNLYKAINDYVSNHTIDIVQFEFGSSLFWAQGVLPNVKLVYVQHEIQYVVERQRLGYNPSKTELFHWNICKRREIAMQNVYDAVITLSEEDKVDLKKDGVIVPIFASFAKVELRNYRYNLFNESSRINLVFVGPEKHSPNYNGLRWFLNNVWYSVLDTYPNIRLQVVGNWTNATISDLTNEYRNIDFLGFVENLSSVLQGNIMIVPIFEGSGIRMKILEAASMGIPFISSSIGARGLGFVDGRNCLISNDSNDFSEKIKLMLSDKKLLNKLATAAHHYVVESFSDERFVESRMICYNYILNK